MTSTATSCSGWRASCDAADAGTRSRHCQPSSPSTDLTRASEPTSSSDLTVCGRRAVAREGASVPYVGSEVRRISRCAADLAPRGSCAAHAIAAKRLSGSKETSARLGRSDGASEP